MTVKMTIPEREAAIDSLELDFVRERLAADGKLVGEDVWKVDTEFKRFLKLVLTGRRPLAMIDRRVDEYWHMFLLFTPQYRQFCSTVMGFFVDHQPRTSVTPVPVGAIGNFIEDYVDRFGALDAFWLETLAPELKSIIEAGKVPEDLGFQWSGWTGPNGLLAPHA